MTVTLRSVAKFADCDILVTEPAESTPGRAPEPGRRTGFQAKPPTPAPFEMQELLGECFVPDFAYVKGENPNWPSKLAHFLKFAAPTDSTPQRRGPPAQRPAQAQQAGASSASSSSGPAAGRVDKGVPQSAVHAPDNDSDVEQGGGGGSELSDDPDFSGSGAFAGASGSGLFHWPST